jgi:hypothetical protein
VQVSYSEVVASRTGPESCATDPRGPVRSVDRGSIGQPLSRERTLNPDADVVPTDGRQHGSARYASAGLVRRGLRPWHVWTLLAREPGDLGVRPACRALAEQAGPRWKGEEP